MNVIFIFFLSFSALHASTTPVEEARASIRSLISPLLPGKKKIASSLLKDFRVDKCQTEKINWSDVLLLRRPVTLVFKFHEGCDVEGNVVPKIFTPFPSNLKLRHLKFYDRVESMNKVTATFESKPVMTIELREGTLFGKTGKVKFEADYQVQIDPMNKEKPVEKNLGGEIRISEIAGQKVSIKEKIFVECRPKVPRHQHFLLLVFYEEK
jgi:hypothetical protein